MNPMKNRIELPQDVSDEDIQRAKKADEFITVELGPETANLLKQHEKQIAEKYGVDLETARSAILIAGFRMLQAKPESSAIENWCEKEFVCIAAFESGHTLGWYRGRIVYQCETAVERTQRFVTLKESLEIYAKAFDDDGNVTYGDGTDYVKWLMMAAAAIR